MAEEEARSFLQRLLEEFPSALGPEEPLPLRPLSRGLVSLEELPGESLELGLRLLQSWSAPAELSALLCQAAVARVLQSDLSPFHCPPETYSTQDQEQEQDQVQLLQSEAVQRFFLNTLREVGVDWQRTPPPPSKSSTSFVPLCSTHAIRNTRRKMEDKHVALAHFTQLFNLDGVERRYYGVFDGHGGVDAATFASTHLQVNLSHQLALHSDATAAFKHAFHRTDHMFRHKAKREWQYGRGGAGPGPNLTTAWLGDSQALLVSQGTVVPLMEPHKPEREDERRRVEELGGCVTFMGCWRVNGTYAVSRAIVGSRTTCCWPVTASFDAVTPAEVPQLVLNALGGGEGPGDPETPLAAAGEGVAQKLVSHAREAGSNDNITVMVVFLRPPQHILAQGGVATATAQPAPDNSDPQDASEQ
ncbi:Protein phosphatase 1F [Merluccius polli]|uniref:Protein phosphatase 1F n=1 Tax=Merluccius polli TaxID=89951 RepID=A0AA47NQM7_MERPO|nr:Protein phosphatase 1F [Merluccius polli]